MSPADARAAAPSSTAFDSKQVEEQVGDGDLRPAVKHPVAEQGEAGQAVTELEMQQPPSLTGAPEPR
jgi:hypothetical protein